MEKGRPDRSGRPSVAFGESSTTGPGRRKALGRARGSACNCRPEPRAVRLFQTGRQLHAEPRISESETAFLVPDAGPNARATQHRPCAEHRLDLVPDSSPYLPTF